MLSLFSGLDRASARSPALERLVPGPFRANAATSRARLLYLSGDFAAAEPAAAQALARAPMERRPPAIIGGARLASGDMDGADTAFRVAARAGWREDLTQIYWLQRALAAGDWELGASRIDAILRSKKVFPKVDELLQPFEESAEGRTALAARLALEPDWLSPYLFVRDSDDPAALDRRSAVIALLPKVGKTLACERVGETVRGLVRRRRFEAAEAVWVAHCPGQGMIGSLAEVDFAGFSPMGESDPFAWQLHPDADLLVRSLPDGRGIAVSITDRRAHAVVARPVRLAPGQVRIGWDAAQDGQPTDRVDVALDCGERSRPPLRGGKARVMLVPDCAVQTLTLWTGPGAGEISVERIVVAPAD